MKILTLVLLWPFCLWWEKCNQITCNDLGDDPFQNRSVAVQHDIVNLNTTRFSRNNENEFYYQQITANNVHNYELISSLSVAQMHSDAKPKNSRKSSLLKEFTRSSKEQYGSAQLQNNILKGSNEGSDSKTTTPKASKTQTPTQTQTLVNDNAPNNYEDSDNDDDDSEEKYSKMNVIESLEQELIYEFANKFKKIPRITYFTCEESRRERQRKQTKTIKFLKELNSISADTMERVKINSSTSSSNKNNYLMRDRSYENNKDYKNFKEIYRHDIKEIAQTLKNDENKFVNNRSIKIPPTPATKKLKTSMAMKIGYNQITKPEFDRDGVLIKVVQMDESINLCKNKNKTEISLDQRNLIFPCNQRGKSNNSSRNNSSRSNIRCNMRNNLDMKFACKATNWLESIFNPNLMRQIVVLDLSCDLMSRKLIKMASRRGLFNSAYHWLFIEEENYEPDGRHSCNNITDERNEKTIFKYIENSQSPGNNGSIESKTIPIIKAKDQENMQVIENFLEKININLNTELILAKLKCKNQDKNQNWNCTYLLYDLWNPGFHNEGKLNITQIGQFTFDDGLRIASWYRRTPTVGRRKNMHLAKIRSIMVINNKNIRDTLEHYLTTHYDTHLDSVHRFNYALLLFVRDMYNFRFVGIAIIESIMCTQSKNWDLVLYFTSSTYVIGDSAIIIVIGTNLITTTTSTWGYVKNGRYDGMVGAVVRKQADICGSPIFFYIERAKVIDYTAKVWMARPCFIFRHPRNARPNQMVFLQPFEGRVWIALMVAGFLTIILLWLLTTIETLLNMDEPGSINIKNDNIEVLAHIRRKEHLSATTKLTLQQKQIKKTKGRCGILSMLSLKGRKKLNFSEFLGENQQLPQKQQKQDKHWHCHSRKEESAFMFRTKELITMGLDAVIFYIGSICQQGLAFSTNLISGRFIILTILLCAFAIFQFYSASVVGTLLKERPKTIRTLRELVLSTIDIGIEDIPYNRDYFMRTKDPDALELYSKKMIKKEYNYNISSENAIHSHEVGVHAKPTGATNWYAPELGMEKVKEGQFAFHIDVATAYKIILDTFDEKMVCELSEIQLFPVQNMVGCLQKGSPLRKMITTGLRRANEAGLMDYQRKVWHSPKPRCVRSIHTEDLHVDMETVKSALALLIFGVSLSLLVFCLEILSYRTRQYFAQNRVENCCGQT